MASIAPHAWNSHLPLNAVLARWTGTQRRRKRLAQIREHRDTQIVNLIRHHRAEFFRHGRLATWAKQCDLGHWKFRTALARVMRDHPHFKAYKKAGRELTGWRLGVTPGLLYGQPKLPATLRRQQHRLQQLYCPRCEYVLLPQNPRLLGDECWNCYLERVERRREEKKT